MICFCVVPSGRKAMATAILSLEPGRLTLLASRKAFWLGLRPALAGHCKISDTRFSIVTQMTNGVGLIRFQTILDVFKR